MRRQVHRENRVKVKSWIAALVLSAGLVPLLGCVSGRAEVALGLAGGNAALVNQFRAYDGSTGRLTTFSDVVARASRADVVLLGEEHSNVVCNLLEAQLFAELLRDSRATTLAMEFFETDTQAAVDDYALSRIDEKAFREKSRQNRAYFTAHRPLIELAKGAGASVLAANAPRRLVSGLRKSGLSYPEYLASLTPEERTLLPAASTAPRDAYWDAFCAIMADHGESGSTSTQPASAPTSQTDELEREQRLYRGFMSQCLWDDSMADSVAKRRASSRDRVLLLIGSFHVAHHGGTKAKLAARRPADRICTIIFRATQDTDFPMDESDRNAGDIVIYGVTPPEKKE